MSKKPVTTTTKVTTTTQLSPAASKWVLVAIVGFIILIVFLTIESNKEQDRNISQGNQSLIANEAQPKVNQDWIDLASDTEKSLKQARGVTSFSELLNSSPPSLMGYINGFENINNGTVRVILQTPLEKSDAEQVGKAIFSLAAYDNDRLSELETLVVRDLSGVDKANIYREDVPMLNIVR